MLSGGYKRRSRPSKCGEDEISFEYVELDVPVGHQGGFNQQIHKNVYAEFSGVDGFNNAGLTLRKSPLYHLGHHTLQIPKHIDSGWLRLGMGKLQATVSLLCAFANHVLLAQPLIFLYALLWLLSCYKGRVAVCETVRLARPKIFTLWPFTENRNVLTSQ